MINNFLRSRVLMIALSLVLILGASNSVQASGVTDGLKATIDQLISIVTNPKYKNDRQTRRAKMKGVIYPKFNFVEMGIRSLGKKTWKSITPDERKAFVDVFGRLLENSYATKLESYQDEKIHYNDEILKGKFAMVKTELIRESGPLQIDYKLIQTGGEWLVYDIVIEGVSMIKNYSSQFAKIIHKDSFSALMDKLNTKVKKLEAGEQETEEEEEDKI